MPQNSFNLLLLFIVLLFCCFGCENRPKTEQVKRGRLTFEKQLEYGAVGTHGSHGWYVKSRHLYFNDVEFIPENDKDVVKDIVSCEPSPNEAVEAMKCVDVRPNTDGTFILRMKNDKPELQQISVGYSSNDEGDWADLEGHWLLFRDYFVNAETGEKKEIKGLPDDPRNYFIGVSPDLETIVYLESGFQPYSGTRTKEQEAQIKKQWDTWQERRNKGILGLWLIDAKTGTVKVIEIKNNQYLWMKRVIFDVRLNPLEVSAHFKWKKTRRANIS